MYPANITRDEARRRSRALEVHSYEVAVDLSGRLPDGTGLERPDATFVSSTVVRFAADEVDTHADLIADRVLWARLDGNDLLAEAFDGEHLLFHCTPGEHVLEVGAVMRYSRTGEGLHRFVDPVDDRVYVYSQLEVADARRVYCAFEQPDLKATFAFEVVAPASWTVLSNSPAVVPDGLGDGFARWTFARTPRMSTYITALCGGEYHTVTDTYVRADGSEIPLTVAVRASLAEHLDADRILETTRRGFDVFEEHFGTRYPFADYAQVFVPEFNFGAMENAGCVTFRDEYIFRSRVTAASYETRDNTILHEMAHMWFGDLVTMRWWDDLWLNESFAEWASHFAQDEIRLRHGDRANPWTAFTNARKTWAYRQDQLPTTHPIAADMVDLEAVELNFDGITYAKGASALRQLVAFVGVEGFLAGVRAYFAEHAWGNTELADLLKALERASGRDLSFFTEQWLQTAGVNTIVPILEVDDDTYSSVALHQTADPRWPTLRQHRIAVGLYHLIDGRLSRTHRVELDLAATDEPQPVEELAGLPVADLLLVNDDDLTYAKIRLDDRSLRTLLDHIHELDSDLARALCWGAAWDMCRDAELPAGDYVDLVLQGVGLESDLTAVGALLGQARTAIDLYAPREQRLALADRFTVGVAQLLMGADPASDHQLAFARALALAVHDDTGAAVLRAWLDGEEVPAGLAVDTDLRWRLLAGLARVGSAEESLIAAELERDPTAAGAEQAAGVRAARPEASAKASAWALALAPDTPNETHVQVCSQFWQVDQEAVNAPYVDAWFDVVEAIADQRDGWGERSTTIRQHMLTHLFPRHVADRAFIERLDAFLASRALPDSVRRLVVERRDEAVRALRCQEAVHP